MFYWAYSQSIDPVYKRPTNGMQVHVVEIVHNHLGFKVLVVFLYMVSNRASTYWYWTNKCPFVWASTRLLVMHVPCQFKRSEFTYLSPFTAVHMYEWKVIYPPGWLQGDNKATQEIQIPILTSKANFSHFAHICIPSVTLSIFCFTLSRFRVYLEKNIVKRLTKLE